ncbi:hypothetical protein [Streptomyces sp. NPDC048473]|uniref:hypothetical protein n=1 Tax=unclassified Streptomyces TaxID=2593676 RepID=UPI00371409EF
MAPCSRGAGMFAARLLRPYSPVSATLTGRRIVGCGLVLTAIVLIGPGTAHNGERLAAPTGDWGDEP